MFLSVESGVQEDLWGKSKVQVLIGKKISSICKGIGIGPKFEPN